MITCQKARVNERSIETPLSLLLLVRLCKPLLLSKLYTPKAGNKQKGFAELVDMRGQGLSDKDCLNVVKVEDPRERSGSSTKSGNKKAEIL